MGSSVGAEGSSGSIVGGGLGLVGRSGGGVGSSGGCGCGVSTCVSDMSDGSFALTAHISRLGVLARGLLLHCVLLLVVALSL